MRRLLLLGAVAALSSSFVGTSTAGAPEPKVSVVLAKSWEAAVEEAKALNVPIVVHSHGFYCGPCWGMHSSVMCNKKYIEFANEHTVEVISLDRLEEGVQKKDKRAETYEAKEDGKPVQYLCEFPGMTVEAMNAMRSSKAGTFNQTGKIPYTCIVDPWTETELKNWGGGQSVQTIQDAVLEAKKALAKDHGKGASRKDVKAIADAEKDAMAKAEKGEFAAALDAFGKLSGKAEKWSESLKDRLKASKQRVVDAAQAALDKVAETKAENAEKAKKDLTTLIGKLRGTGLEDKAKELLAGF
jgi:hypothetical protein